MYTTLISPEKLLQNLNTPNWLIFDCRTELSDPGAGRRAYEQGHLPGALYADLNEDLCGPILPLPGGYTATGRHPLPDVDTFVATLHRWGVTNQTQVIAYDDKGGGLSAARLWWMLRWVGHDAVAVLDGGWQGWLGKGDPVSSETASSKKASGKPFQARVRPEMLVGAEEVLKAREVYSQLYVFDSRAPERYRGETEPIDPVTGRVPWALNAPYADTQTTEGFFRPQKELNQHFQKLSGNADPKNAIFYCGSGVTAAANLLTLKHAGLGDGKLYAGSWSDWITDPAHPVAFAQNYTAPVDQLLHLGEDLALQTRWPDYLSYGLTSAHLPDLIRMATDWDLHYAMADDPRVFAPTHAWRALGQLRAEAATEPLLSLFDVLIDSDWATEDLPEVYALIGPAALPALTAYIRDTAKPDLARWTAINAIEKIGNQHPEARAACVEFLTEQLTNFDEQDEEFNGYLVGALVELKAVESASTIEDAFAADMVDESLYGDWEEVQVHMGLLEERIAPLPRFTSIPEFSPRALDDIGAVPTRKKAPKKEKAKRKQEKKSRKTNQKKKKK